VVTHVSEARHGAPAFVVGRAFAGCVARQLGGFQ